MPGPPFTFGRWLLGVGVLLALLAGGTTARGQGLDTLFIDRSESSQGPAFSGFNPQIASDAYAVDGLVVRASGNMITLYDVASDTWEPDTEEEAFGPFTLDTGGCSSRGDIAITHAGTKLLFAGGGSGGCTTDRVDVYDVETDTWSVDTLSAPRFHISAVTVGDKAIFAGGGNDGSESLQVDVYDAATDTWTTDTLAHPLYDWGNSGEGATARIGTEAYFFPQECFRCHVQIYDASTGTWEERDVPPDLNDLFFYGDSDGRSAVAGGRIFLTPGSLLQPGVTETPLWVYDPGTHSGDDSWTELSLPTPRVDPGIQPLVVTPGDAEYVIVPGGNEDLGFPFLLPSHAVEIYDAIADEWFTAPEELPQGRNEGGPNMWGGSVPGTAFFANRLLGLFLFEPPNVTAGADAYAVDEDGILSVGVESGVLANDTDRDGDPLTATLLEDVASGSLALNADGSFTYQPDADFAGTDTFRYRAEDASGNAADATGTITVNGVDDPPVANADAYTATEDQTLAVGEASGVLANDEEVDGETLTAAVVQSTQHGALTLEANGSFTYAPGADFFGTDTFTYTASDGTSDSDPAPVTITVTGVQDPPTAQGDAYSTLEDSTLSVDAPGVLANDDDPDGDSLTAELVDDVSNGTLALDANGAFTYTPDAGFSGSDAFTYAASDGTATSAERTVTITVASTNDPPVAEDDTYTGSEDAVLSRTASQGVLANDTDPDGDDLTAQLVDDVTNGTLTLEANGGFTYTPNTDVHGTDAFTYRASDGDEESPVATVTLTIQPVNDAPTATADAYSGSEDQPLAVDADSGVLANDTDVDGDVLTALLVDDVTDGTLALDTDGAFSYTPDADFDGTDAFTYRADDGTDTSTVTTVTLTIEGSNDAPVATADAYTATEDQALTVTADGGVLANDTDADGDALEALLVSDVTSGTLTLSADGAFTYTPSADFDGTDAFTYRASDGTAQSAEATVTLTVQPVNDAPIAAADTFDATEDEVLTIDAATGVLANDTDADGDTLTAQLQSDVANGTLTLNADGSFTYTPDADFDETDGFTYRASDGTAVSSTVSVTIEVAPVNDAPDAVADVYTPTEDQSLIVDAATGVLANDTDADGDALTAVLVDDVSNGALTLNADGSFTYVPDAHFHGTDTFTYRAADPTSTSAPATVTLQVQPVNDPPVAADDAYSGEEDATLTVSAADGVLSNDTDGDGDSLSAVLVSDVSNGTLTLGADGSFSYVPDADVNGTDSFTYRAADGALTSDAATVVLTVTPVNDAPVARDDSYSGTEDEPLTVSATQGVLANDTDVDGDVLTVQLVDDISNGTLSLNDDGSFSYTPNADFNGTDTFTYAAQDGNANSDATVTLTIGGTNDAPTAAADQYDATEDETLSVDAVEGVLANDTDADGDPLTAQLQSSVTNGALTLNADGSFTYTPDADFDGTDTFTYRASDGTAFSGVATVTISVAPVNDAPTATDDAYTAVEDETLSVEVAQGVLANDTDADGDALTAALVSDVSNGTLTLGADGSFSYVPDADFDGTDTFRYAADDGTASTEAVVTLSVTPVNDAPTGVADTYDATEDEPLTVSAANGVLANDTDVDGDALTAVLVNDVAHGTLTLQTDGAFDYVPDADFAGTDTFTYQASDGVLTSPITTVTLTVQPVNDAPAAVADSYDATEDEMLTVDAADGVLANDTDADGDPLTAQLVNDVSSGALTLSADGAFSYTPDADFDGTDAFTYRASDGTAQSAETTVTLTVQPVNDPPTAAADSYDATEDEALTVSAVDGVLANDTDVDGDALTAGLVSGGANGMVTLNADGSFTYTPDADFHGTDTFVYAADDGARQSNATVTLTVAPVNDPPQAADDGYGVQEDETLIVDAANGVLANDTDVDGDALTAGLVSDVSSGTLTLSTDGSFTYTPEADFAGTDSFTYAAQDGSAAAEAVVTIEVGGTNDAPVAVADTYDATEDETLTVSAIDGVLANDTDADGDALTAVLVNDVSNGTLTLQTDGAFDYVPDADFAGTDTFTYQASDGVLTSPITTVTLSVQPVNDAPVLVDDVYETVEDNPLTVSAPNGVLANDTDADGDTLTAARVNGPSNGTLTLAPDGAFEYVPDADFYGTDTFTYAATDGTTGGEASVAIEVAFVNDAPAPIADGYETREDQMMVVSVGEGVLANDSDADGDTLTAHLVTPAPNGTVSLDPDGSFTYIPNTNYSGTDQFVYAARDGTAQTTATVDVTVTPINDPPRVAPDGYGVAEDGTLDVGAATGVLANDDDVDGDTLTASLVSDVSNGTLALRPDGGFTYTPNADFAGTDAFTYAASDGTLAADATVTIQVAGVSDAPRATDDGYTGTEDETLTVSASDGVLANDTDPDGDPFTAHLVQDVTRGTLTLNPDGSFVYGPDPHAFGVDTFTYAARDSTGQTVATVTLTLTAVNDPPQAVADAYGATEESTLTVPAAAGVLANDTDVDGDSLTVQLVTGVSSGTLALDADGAFTYTPDLDFSGTDAFTYAASDGSVSTEAVVTIEVDGTNDAPVALTDEYDVLEDETLTVSASDGVLANDTDADGDSLTAQLQSTVTNGTLTLNADGSFTYTPDADFDGTDTFTYRAADGVLASDPVTVILQVEPVTDVPRAADDAYSSVEDVELVVAASDGVLGNDVDPEGGDMTVELTVPVEHGTLTLAPDGAFTYTPAADFFGTDRFEYRSVSDDRRSAPATVTLNVANVNDAPAGVTDAYTLVEDDTLVVDVPGVLANDTDADGDTLTATVVVGPTDGGLVLSANGSFSYVPAPDTSGERSFTYRAGDGTAQSAPVSVALTILPANDPPRLREDVTQTLEDTSVVVDVLGNDDDPDGEIDASTVEIARSATQGTATVEAEGTLLYTPDRNATGADSLQYVVSDTEGATSDPAWVRVTIVPVNDPPVAVTDTAATPEATPVTIPVLANDRDPDGDALTVVGWTEPVHGTVTAPGDTALVYTPAGDFFGPDSLRYTVRDPAGTTAQAVVRVQVTFVDDPPVAVADTLSTPQNVALVLDLTANDVDPERGPLHVVSTGEPSLGTVTQVSDTLWVYQPEPDVSGTDAFPYVVRDEGGQTASAEVVVSVSACAYAITDLGTLGGTASRAFDVAETGAVVGLAETATGDVRAFVWQEESTRALASEGPAQALAIHGTTVVGTQQVSEGLAAVRWSLDAPDTPGVALSDSFSVAFGVHGGTVVGARKDGARFRAVQWDGGTETLLDTPSGAESQATAVDASGTAIGFAVQDGVPTALRWATPDAPDVLGTGRAFGVGAAGSIVGQSNGVATRWAEDGTSTALADPGPATLAYGSNDAGTVVGGMWASASAARKAAPWAGPWSSDLRAQLRPPGVGEEAAPKAEATSAFVWQAGVLTNLESCLAADAGWTLVEARAINNAGQIVGFGLRDGTPRGYLLTPVNNQAPEAVADLSRLLGGVETVIDVLANDRDADGDALRVASVGPAAVGTVALRDDGQVVYQAPPTYQGSDRFAYVVDDGSGGAARGTVTVDVAPRPSGLVLGAGAPNPFRDRATFEYVLPEAARVQLEVFNVLGQRVARVLDAEKPAGIHTATVDARALASGLYFFRLSTRYGIQVQRLSLVR